MSGRKRDELLLQLGREFQVHDEALLRASHVDLGVTDQQRERTHDLWWQTVTAVAGRQARSKEGLAVKAMILAAVIRSVGLKPGILRDLAESLCNDLVCKVAA